MKKNIVLCGFMGSGKSTVGRLLAKELDCGYLDLDDYIQERAEMSIPQIFERFGESGFRDLEHLAVCSLGTSPRQQVISTGGGTLTFSRNVPVLQKNSIIIYLDVGFDTCWERIRNSSRPLVRSKTREELAALYESRDSAYRAASQWALPNPGSSQQLAQEILRRLAAQPESGIPGRTEGQPSA